MRLRAGHVVRLLDEETRPEKVKRHICVSAERRLFLRINSERFWTPAFELRADQCEGLIEHDSFVELRNLYRQPAAALRRDLQAFGNALGVLAGDVAHALARAAHARS